MVEREDTYYHGRSALVHALITGLGTISMIMNGGATLASGLGHRMHQAGSMGKRAAAERKVPGAMGCAGAGAATLATGGVAAGAAAAHAVPRSRGVRGSRPLSGSPCEGASSPAALYGPALLDPVQQAVARPAGPPIEGRERGDRERGRPRCGARSWTRSSAAGALPPGAGARPAGGPGRPGRDRRRRSPRRSGDGVGERRSRPLVASRQNVLEIRHRRGASTAPGSSLPNPRTNPTAGVTIASGSSRCAQQRRRAGLFRSCRPPRSSLPSPHTPPAPRRPPSSSGRPKLAPLTRHRPPHASPLTERPCTRPDDPAPAGRPRCVSGRSLRAPARDPRSRVPASASSTRSATASVASGGSAGGC